MSGQTENLCASSLPHDRLNHLNDELHIVRRLLNHPEACMSRPEVLDVLRIAVDRIHSQYQTLAFDLQRDAESIPPGPHGVLRSSEPRHVG